MPLMDLIPHQMCPRDENADLVEEVRVVDLGVGNLVQSGALEDVIRPEERSVGKRWQNDQHASDDDDSQPKRVGGLPTPA